jgi:uncharacterized protein (DUF608 family)
VEPSLIGRRQFFARSLGALSAAASLPALTRAAEPAPAQASGVADPVREGEALEHVAFPLGGIGAGCVCLEGAGGLTHVSVRNRPRVGLEPGFFAAISVLGPRKVARVVEGPVPRWKLFSRAHASSGAAAVGLGLPRYAAARFRAHFPFARIELEDPSLELSARITGWSPFDPGDADAMSLPVAGIEYTFLHNGHEPLDAVFSFNAHHFLGDGNEGSPEPSRSIRAIERGFALHGGPSGEDGEAWMAVAADDAQARVNLAWFRGDWFDPQTMAWRDVEEGRVVERGTPEHGEAPRGASVYVPFRILPGRTKSIRIRLSWYCPSSGIRVGGGTGPAYRPWYAGVFPSIDALNAHWDESYEELRSRSERFSQCFFDTSLPGEAIEAVAANLSILKSPTLLRQEDGRLWGWEGCDEDHGQGHGTCTHVWNYAQSIAHLFPALERGLRETEFGPGQDASGHQAFRVPLPIRPAAHDEPAAADGQLGGILKVYREWRVSGDSAWLATMWPAVRQSLEYCIATWDPEQKGWLEEPQHTTYDIEFWGPNGMTTSLYLGALRAAATMARHLGHPAEAYEALAEKGGRLVGEALFNGEFFIQKTQWKGLRARLDAKGRQSGEFGAGYSPEAADLQEREGPKYQYGPGCLSDGVIGAWLAWACGLGPVLDPAHVRSHLSAVFRHNFKADLSSHANPQRPTYALGREAGLVLCTWPRGGSPTLPFVYSSEVWTGIEYQVASHMISCGMVAEGLEVVRGCRSRYDGRVRNPFDEYEWGHWYARAMASYALLGALSGARYDAVDKVLYLEPQVDGDFKAFLCTATGYGTVGVVDGKPFLSVTSGTIEARDIRYRRPAS